LLLPFNRLLEDLNGLYSLINTESGADFNKWIEELDPALLGANSELGKLLALAQAMALLDFPDPGSGGGGGGGNYKCPICGDTFTTESGLINHYGKHPDPKPPLELQHGGRVMPGMDYVVGERGIEVFRPDVSGRVMPLDPWGTTYTTDYAPTNKGEGRQLVHLQVFVGDEKLIDKVIDAVDQKVRE
jgi:hypothetical protein